MRVGRGSRGEAHLLLVERMVGVGCPRWLAEEYVGGIVNRGRERAIRVRMGSGGAQKCESRDFDPSKGSENVFCSSDSAQNSRESAKEGQNSLISEPKGPESSQR